MAASTTRRSGAALALLALSGCVFPAVPHWSGRALEQADVARVEPGRTTKHELFERLGPPWAIAGPGEVVTLESPAAMLGSGGLCQLRPGGAYRVDSGAWFEPFASRRRLREGQRVYYWYAWRAGGWDWFLLLVLVASCSNEIQELWVLVDEETGLVEDVVFRG